MKKIIILILILFLLNTHSVTSQSPNYSSLIGLRATGEFQNYIDKGIRKIFYQISFEPYYMFFIEENWGVGVIGEVDFAGGNLSYVDYPETIYGIGLVSRFYYPFKLKQQFLRLIRFYSESSFSFSNYHLTENTYEYSEDRKLEYSILRLIPLGITFNINKGLNLELSPVIYKYFPCKWKIDMNFGLEYHFGNIRTD